MLNDNFEQQFQSCVLNAENNYKSAQNQINSLNASKNEVKRIFRDFRVFKYALWQKTKTRKCWKSAESFINRKNLLNLLNPCGTQNNSSLKEIKCVIYFCFLFSI